MKSQTKWVILVFLTPILFSLIYITYYKANRGALMQRLVDSGVVALFDEGMVTQEDLNHYFNYPPTETSLLLSALEMTPEDVAGLENEDPSWFETKTGMLLINRIIQHIALIKHLNQRWEASGNEKDLQKVKEYREELMRESMEEDLAQIDPDITHKEMLAYYIDHSQEFHQEGKRLARHIMLSKNSSVDPDDPFQTTPQSILTRLQNGEDFQNIIQQESQTNTIHNGGILGWHSRGAFQEDFDHAIWALEIGEITGPIEVGKSIHFIQLMDEEPEGIVPFKECKDHIRELLIEEKRKIQRYKLLGLSSEALAMPNPSMTEEYQEALLQAAYAREWDKNMEIVQKTKAFERYQNADLLFRSYINQIKDSQQNNTHHEDNWNLQRQAAEQLLKEIQFHFLVKMEPSTPDESASNHEQEE